MSIIPASYRVPWEAIGAGIYTMLGGEIIHVRHLARSIPFDARAEVAEQIVRAMNSHERLVAALQEIAELSDGLHGEPMEETVLMAPAIARAALAEVEEAP